MGRESKRFLVFSFLLIIFSIFVYPVSLESQKIKFIKKFEIGSEEKSEEIFFKISDIKADKENNIFILDSADNCIKKFTKDGRFVKKGGRKGEGPGELMSPSSLAIDENGNIYVNEIIGRRLIIYDNNLNFIKQIKLQSPGIKDIVAASSETILGLSYPITLSDKYFIKFSNDGFITQSFFEKFHPRAPRLQYIDSKILVESSWAFPYLSGIADINHDKTKIAFTYELPENPYKIFLLDEEGKVIKVMEKKIKNYKSQELYDFFKIFSKTKRYDKEFISFGIVGVYFTKENFLISQLVEFYKNKGQSELRGYFLDLFSPNGNLIEGDISFKEKIFSIDSNNNVYTIYEDKEGIPKVVVYSLKIKE